MQYHTSLAEQSAVVQQQQYSDWRVCMHHALSCIGSVCVRKLHPHGYILLLFRFSFRPAACDDFALPVAVQRLTCWLRLAVPLLPNRAAAVTLVLMVCALLSVVAVDFSVLQQQLRAWEELPWERPPHQHWRGAGQCQPALPVAFIIL